VHRQAAVAEPHDGGVGLPAGLELDADLHRRRIVRAWLSRPPRPRLPTMA
jgi:hypothetical protein